MNQLEQLYIKSVEFGITNFRDTSELMKKKIEDIVKQYEEIRKRFDFTVEDQVMYFVRYYLKLFNKLKERIEENRIRI